MDEVMDEVLFLHVGATAKINFRDIYR